MEAAGAPEVNLVLPGEMSPQMIYDKCWALARNLWWTWHPEVINLFRDLDPIRWRQLDHNPVALLRDFTPESLAARAAEMVLFSRINYAHRRLKEYMSNTKLWARTHAGVLGSKPVAYFSAEFGIHESMPIYSGGLGVLSGDHVKSASGLGDRAVLRSGLLPPVPRREGLPAGGVSRHQGREHPHGAGRRRRRETDHDQGRYPRRVDLCPRLAAASGTRAAVSAGLRRGRE
jgi:hypothetical protein